MISAALGPFLPVLGSVMVLLLVFLLSYVLVPNREPPGPRPLPLFGNLLQLNFKEPHRTFIQLSKKFGSVFTFHMGPNKAVVLVGFQTMREALVDYGKEFGERYVSAAIKEIGQDYGVAFTNGETWREMRRFALSNLKDFGMGRRSCEDKIREECEHLLQRIKSFRGGCFYPHEVLTPAVSNIICSLVYGDRFDYEDPEFKGIIRRLKKSIQLKGSTAYQLYQTFPTLGKFMSKTVAEDRDIFVENKGHYQKMIQQLKETLDPQQSRGIVDAFLIHQQRLEEAGLKDSQFHAKNLVMTVANLFAAGTETTATTLRWALLYMAKYPEIQDRVHEEISGEIGARQVWAEDRKNLPFTDAVLHETQRHGDIAPLALLHRTSRDVVFQGHLIRKGTMVIPVLASAHLDENQWEKPLSFYPAHFLNKDGRFVKREAFMPFSAGRRVCLGESLARMELFLFFVILMQHFRFTPPPGVTEEELDLTPGVGLSRCPKPHQLCAIPLL